MPDAPVRLRVIKGEMLGVAHELGHLVMHADAEPGGRAGAAANRAWSPSSSNRRCCRALELLTTEGIAEPVLLDQCRVPAGIFRSVTARTPAPAPAASPQPRGPASSHVVSLFN